MNKVTSITRSQKQRKPTVNPLGIKTGGVTKRKGVSVDSKPVRDRDEDDMDDDDDLVEEVTAEEDNIAAAGGTSQGINLCPVRCWNQLQEKSISHMFELLFIANSVQNSIRVSVPGFTGNASVRNYPDLVSCAVCCQKLTSISMFHVN